MFMRSQENPGVLQVMAMVVLLLPFNVYGVPKAMWEDYTVLTLVMPKFHLMKSFFTCSVTKGFLKETATLFEFIKT